MMKKEKRQLLNVTLLVCLFMCFCNSGYAFATIKLYLQENYIETYNDLIDFKYLYGLGPGSINIMAVENDSTEYCIYESTGCSVYETTQTVYSTYELTVYSDLACQWTTDVCREDREHPLCPEEASIKFSLKFDSNGSLIGRLMPINYSEQRDIYIEDEQGLPKLIPVPAMNEILESPLKYDLESVVRAYLAKGLQPKEIYNFMLQYDQELLNQGFKYNSNDSYYQIYSIYKFILKHFDCDIGLDELKELGQITKGVRIFYGNPSLNTNDYYPYGMQVPDSNGEVHRTQ